MRNRLPVPGLVALTILALPTTAYAAVNLTADSVFWDASPAMKAVMIVLVLAAIAAIGVTAAKLRSGPTLTGGSAFVSALRLGGPLIGLLGASWNALTSFLAIANVGVQPPFPVLAPGFAESTLMFWLGLMSGVVAVVCHWIIEARIDRAVLKS
ncbi:MAG: MotA/TolQ/ExbB proton channel family protein [Brevundimonas sp.]|nr:MotA/TolQ/ExbB proton channel family protein [Brevundimonas sp.]